jgi:hypothetical protein
LTITYPTVHSFNVGEPDRFSTASQTVRWSCGDEPPSIIGEHRIKSDLGALTGGYYLEWVWKNDYDERGFLSFCGGMRSAFVRCQVGPPWQRPSDCSDYLVNPARFVGETDCGGGILEEKLSFSPWCPCEE